MSFKEASKRGGGRDGVASFVSKKGRHRKHVTFAREGNRVRFVKVPPRSMNHHYWFTEMESIVKKGINFEVEPNIDVSLDVGCRVQLTTLAAQPGSSPRQQRDDGGAGGKGRSGRVFLEVEASPPTVLGAAVRRGRRLTVASVAVGEMEKVRIVLPTGSYRLRCVGPKPLQVFAQAWDIERKLD